MREFVIECVPGLREVTRTELMQLGSFGSQVIEPFRRDDLLVVAASADRLKSLRSAISLYERLHFSVPRPKALLGDESFRLIAKVINGIRSEGGFASFSLHAAGNETAPFIRLRDAIEAATGLMFSDEEADMVIRIIPGDTGGWDCLFRLTPRPLTVRPWRVCQFDGAVNAAVAAAMVFLSHPLASDRFLNLMAGSGTLMIERALAGPFAKIVGGDNDQTAMDCARRNIRAAGLIASVDLVWMDAIASGLDDSSIDVICVDPPWGTHLGKDEDIGDLYRGIFNESERILVNGGRLIVLSAAKQLTRDILRDVHPSLTCKIELPISQRGLSPSIFVVQKD